jgi:integrase
MGKLTQRSKGSWSFRLELERDPDTGRRRQRTVTVRGTKRDAERERTRLQAEVDAGMAGTAGALTVRDFLERWLRDHITPNMAARTTILHTQMLRNYLIPHIGQMQLDKLRPQHIVGLYTTIRAAGRKDGRGALSPTTLSKVHVTLSAALHTAVRWRLITTNPCKAVAAPREAAPVMQTLTPDQARALLDAARAVSVQWHAFFTLALTTGMRSGELTGVRWSDIDLPRRSLTVRQIAQRLPGQGTIVKEPKTQTARRQIALSAEMVALLKQHRTAQTAQRLAASAWHDHDLVFTGRDGSFLNENTVRHTFGRILTAAGLPHMRIHDLRHSAATLMLQAGIHPKIVSERLGHATITITLDRYSHVTPTMQEQAADTIEELLKAR